MRRLILFDHADNPLGELSPSEVMEATRTEAINGEHTLTIRTTRVMEKGWRVLTQDGRGVWREHVVYGTDASHAGGDTVGTYYCVWSVMNDLIGTTVSSMPGVQNPVTASVALDAALAGTSRWVRGTVTNTNSGGASMYDMSGWEAVSVLLENWGGELDTTIQVGDHGVAARKVDLYSQQGSDEALRRYDFGADLKSVSRRVEDGPMYCRISPRGKGEQVGGGYGRSITIASVNDGKDYLEYAPMVDIAKLPKSGGWEYPTLIVENPDIETPAELKAWGESVLEAYCTPSVTYDVDVVQASAEGIDMQGVSLGDVVHLVDRKFGDGIRLSGRVTSMTVDMLEERSVHVVIGSVDEWLAEALGGTQKAIKDIRTVQTYMATSEYVSELLERINEELNATGGYTYIVDGEGFWSYTCAVSDPTVGAEAKAIIQGGGSAAVVNIKGGGIRIANSLTTQGEWDWKTVFVSGHIAAELVTAAQITTGYIGNAGDTFIDLDNHTVQLGQTADKHVVLDTNSFRYYDGSTSVFYLGEAASNPYIRIGPTSQTYTVIHPDGSGIYQDGVQIANFGKTTNGQLSISLGKPASSGESRMLINPSGVGIYKNTSAYAYFGLGQDDKPIIQLGKSSSSYIYLSGDGSIDMKGGGVTLAHFGYDSGYNAQGTLSDAPYYTLGNRRSGTSVGNYSVAEGDETEASGYASHAEGQSTKATAPWSHAEGSGSTASHNYTHAGGRNSKASGEVSFAHGYSAEASGMHSFALGLDCKSSAASSFTLGRDLRATGIAQIVIGESNVSNSSHKFIVGNGLTSNANIMYLADNGNLWIKGTLTQNSDRRLKEHLAYLDDDAVEFVRKLRPALFEKDGERHLGFYAQDVDEADSWDTATVKPDHSDESLDFDPLTLEYTALIAPLVAYCQHLEKRIEALEEGR